MNFSPYKHYSSFRQNAYAQNGIVATSSPLAAQAGLEMLKCGGNAVDAAIATAITLTVVEPTSNGIGGDAFAIVYDNGKLHGLNSSGPSPSSLSIEAVKAKGFDHIPPLGVIPINVPGAPAAWIALSKKFGRLPFEKLFEPAIRHAENGYRVSNYLSQYWKKAYARYSSANQPIFKTWFDTFAPLGAAPEPGELYKSKDHAKTLKALAKSKCDSFYRGEMAHQIVNFLAENDGFLTIKDLEDFKPEWVEPVSVPYRGYDVYELPPNGQGISALMALNILNQIELSPAFTAENIHYQIEAMKCAFADLRANVADPRFHKYDIASFLDEAYGKKNALLLSPFASTPLGKPEATGGTVYLSTADAQGQMVSFIQSNYMGFGSGVVIPNTGIALHNRAHNFSFDPNHPNALEGNKRPLHTIIPGFLMKGSKPIGGFGVMGAFMQPQGHLQVISHTLDLKLSPQDALDAPRWQWLEENKIYVEKTMPHYIIEDLIARGHDVSIPLDNATFGRGQIIWHHEKGGYIGGTESRCDGTISID